MIELTEDPRCVVCGGPRTDPPALDCRRCRFTDFAGRRHRPRCELCGRFVAEMWAMSWPVHVPYPAPPRVCVRCDDLLQAVGDDFAAD